MTRRSVASNVKVSGLFVALLTPFDTSGQLDRAALTGLVEHTLRDGVDGVVALGTTGEFADLTPGERLAVVETTVAAVRGRVPVAVGIGALGTAEACAHAVVAKDAGADAVLSLPPLFWKLDDAELFEHFATVARATDLPVLLYDIPVFAGASLSPALVRRIAEELPSVVGIKLTVPDFGSISSVLAAVKPVRPDFSVTVGFEDLGWARCWREPTGSSAAWRTSPRRPCAPSSTRSAPATCRLPPPRTPRCCASSRSTSRPIRRSSR